LWGQEKQMKRKILKLEGGDKVMQRLVESDSGVGLSGMKL